MTEKLYLLKLLLVVFDVCKETRNPRTVYLSRDQAFFTFFACLSAFTFLALSGADFFFSWGGLAWPDTVKHARLSAKKTCNQLNTLVYECAEDILLFFFSYLVSNYNRGNLAVQAEKS